MMADFTVSIWYVGSWEIKIHFSALSRESP
jgi:hypothetical protein